MITSDDVRVWDAFKVGMHLEIEHFDYEEEFLKQMADVAGISTVAVKCMLDRAGVSVSDLMKLAEGGYRLCDGYCNE